jgi:hypothetical protein
MSLSRCVGAGCELFSIAVRGSSSAARRGHTKLTGASGKVDSAEVISPLGRVRTPKVAAPARLCDRNHDPRADLVGVCSGAMQSTDGGMADAFGRTLADYVAEKME